ncbi:MAG: hypothetical protein WC942_10840 [Clostridia bacterium]|jgi:hypothetical protein
MIIIPWLMYIIISSLFCFALTISYFSGELNKTIFKGCVLIFFLVIIFSSVIYGAITNDFDDFNYDLYNNIEILKLNTDNYFQETSTPISREYYYSLKRNELFLLKIRKNEYWYLFIKIPKNKVDRVVDIYELKNIKEEIGEDKFNNLDILEEKN